MSGESREEVLARHRPYGLDCKCGRPINSDGDWSRHALSELRESLSVTTREQLDALPDGSVVRELDVASPRVLEKYSTDTLAELYGPWVQMGFEIPTDAVVLPALLLFSPDWETP